MLRHARSLALVPLALALAACSSDPPDDTPLGRDIVATMARPEQAVQQVQVQHVLLAFVGAKRGSESKHDYATARTLTDDVLARARAGEDFAALVKQFSYEEGSGIETLTLRNRGDYAVNFEAIAFRLAVGEIGVAAFHSSKSPFGFHVIKRLQ